MEFGGQDVQKIMIWYDLAAFGLPLFYNCDIPTMIFQ
jgi:hypothetical protein